MTKPSAVLVFGSGRWAKLYTRLLHSIYPSCRIFVHTSSNWRSSFKSWVDAEGLSSTVTVINALSEIDFADISFALVVNKAASHYQAALFCLLNNCHVGVEKPICIHQSEYEHLKLVANSRSLVLFPLLVFAFHPSIHYFFSLLPISFSTDIEIDFSWSDSTLDTRHGALQNIDKSIPSYVDVLPHVLSITSLLGRLRQPKSLFMLDLESDYSSVDLSLTGINTKYHVAIRRGSIDIRSRLIHVSSDGWKASLDYSIEPGYITIHGLSNPEYIQCDPWSECNTPLIRQLHYFVECIYSSSSPLRLLTLQHSVVNFFCLLSCV